MSNIKILVCCHKDDLKLSSDVFFPIHVGKAISKIDLGIQGDHTGDNISDKNASYCELTGLYWAWKNMKGVDYIGLCHYRRYFDFNGYGTKGFPTIPLETSHFEKVDLNLNSSIIDYLEKDYVITAKETSLTMPLYYSYCGFHNYQELRYALDYLISKDSDKYSKVIKEHIVQGNLIKYYNMFVMSWTQFDRYCNWLFPILSYMEGKIDISNYDLYHKRAFGFIGEYLFNVYLWAEKLKVKQVPILKFADNDTEKLPCKNAFFYKVRCLRNSLAMKLLKY